MTKNEQQYAEWIRRIEDSFAGPNGIVGERSLAFARNEKNIQSTMPFVHNGFYVRLMDAFFDFSVQSFESTAQKPELYDAALLTSCSWTLRSASNLFWQGYYCQATGLLRSALESVALLAGEKNGSFDSFQLCRFLESGSNQGKAPWELGNEGQKLMQKAVKALFKKDRNISDTESKALFEFYNCLHTHVHLAFWSFFQLFRQGKEKGTVGVLPEINDNDGNAFIMASEAVAWAHLRLQSVVFDVSVVSDEYNILNDAFAFASADWSNAMLRDAWTKVLNARVVGKGRAA